MKTCFKFEPDHVIDIITNSSSELFVLKGETKSAVTDMVSAIYPDYRTEYEEIVHSSELSMERIWTYLQYAYGYSNHRLKVEGFTEDDIYEPKDERPYRDWRNIRDSFVVEANREKIVKAIDPEGKAYFLFSIDDNPNWERQEMLEAIGERYHLG